ncbi:N-acetylmuramic acid-6-phosphate etherase [Alkalihalobacillus alcalophilus ATCC 27647 = CGMCC 1.3604]|uniref:N-acetylmuramic acid 6-phosphate etherase n=1 Tax=Alkalihalobacillus alcalophilus ATCC 27647 = CGMCC 1.3604 TaxID=1218173 RepID=A0A094XJQ0_ALKAL|nr:N-acetylmuramic acid 6-phosphate etherase [Alkalihalobacillus alcalophilus]KGA99005.1 N-acetylmuramic acid-6-phosphate etherase [Alkalihalobacillus alcalophilus ATCC 27647 = CGMCC 1.3604]MED1560641.1 N-acetylmuramic acid 6-phosphate etherase [Alkalihalobacillus alcalophilus]THG88353.1 N-acetylmuramic acid-6-phosphate etherase [Alkalihalobacillus alcalophilus ATCC 27647 = CGMCC 1.3604]
MELDLSQLTTEKRNEQTLNIDQLSTLEVLTLMNKEDETVALAVRKCLPAIEQATNIIYEAMKNGGRLFYVGAGTSGRLGVIDASECPPTFRTEPGLVQGIMAGGEKAITTAVEGIEDRPEEGKRDLEKAHFGPDDVVVGIAASGRTPYVIGAIEYATSLGAKTIALTANTNSELSEVAEYAIEVSVGPEVLTGSTRLKAATAHKMVLNMLSTTTMIKLGKVYENLMVDLNASNLKLKERAKNIVMNATGASEKKAGTILMKANNDVKVAIVMIRGNVGYEEALALLQQGNGFVRKAIELAQRN